MGLVTDTLAINRGSRSLRVSVRHTANGRLLRIAALSFSLSARLILRQQTCVHFGHCPYVGPTVVVSRIIGCELNSAAAAGEV